MKQTSFSRKPRLFYGLATSLAFATLLALTGLAQPPPPGAAAEAPVPGGKVVDFNTLLPLLPEPPAAWKAEPAEGSTDDLGDAQITTVHRDYTQGDGDNVPTTSISILDSASNPEYVEATTAGWTSNTSDAEGYTKSLRIDGMPGFETFENDGKHGMLWLLVAKRYFLQIETTAQDAKELQEWLKRIDLKKLAEIK
ncbi:MAG: hypothetical protein ACR2ID_11905 [Chthoniobacterales bacterium]